MIRRINSLLLFGLAAISPFGADAAITFETTNVPTINHPGFRTYQLTAIEESGRKITGFNFDASNDSGLGIHGPLLQVPTFLGQQVIFHGQDPCPICSQIVTNPPDDTHFLVRVQDGIAVNALEGPNYLVAAWASTNTANATNSLPFVQLVAPNGSMIVFRGDFTLQDANGVDSLSRVDGFLFIVPEPGSLALGAVAALGARSLLRWAKRKRPLAA